MADWKTIDSCPKDGTAFDVWAQALGPAGEILSESRFASVVYVKAGDSYFLRGLPPEFRATHWMAIPDKPKKL